ncbi:MAG TPA: Gfo/Idh/MocA family oxidoreductase [Bryobacteraceae bacterium]|nr:Gfo/Idh/MocA family oxidoreductase [Bryobacteraceae bacterium]
MPDSQIDRRRFVVATGFSAVSAGRVMGANDRIAVANIGCGGRGLLKEVLQFARETNVEVTAVCDTWRQKREQAAAAVNAALGSNPEQFVHYQDVVSNPKIDAVIIGTPDHQHCTQLTAAARAGKDAYVEKPLAMDMKELVTAVDEVKKHQRVVQVGTQIRSLPSSMAARAFVTTGGLGKVLKVEQSRNSYEPYWARYGERPVTEADVDWKAFLMHRKFRPFEARQYAGWYGYREFSRGPHTNLMVHFIDTVHHITGCGIPSHCVTLGGTFRWKNGYTAPDSVETILEYPDGFMVRYCSVFGNSANNYFKFLGTRGVLDASRWNWNTPFEISGDGSREPDKIAAGAKIPPMDSTPHMKNWLECLRSRKQPNAPIEAGYQHSVAVILADESFIRGVRMVYDPAKRAVKQG